MTEQTPPDWVLIEAAKRSGWTWFTPEELKNAYETNAVFRALCDMIQRYEQPPVDRKLLCAREAYKYWASMETTQVSITDACVRAIELWEDGFGK